MLKTILAVLVLLSSTTAQIPDNLLPNNKHKFTIPNQNIHVINSTKTGDYLVYKLALNSKNPEVFYLRVNFRTHLITDLSY